jgi:hypothetical protein
MLKLDFGKAYNKVNWVFLLDCHRVRGFLLFGVACYINFCIMILLLLRSMMVWALISLVQKWVSQGDLLS